MDLTASQQTPSRTSVLQVGLLIKVVKALSAFTISQAFSGEEEGLITVDEWRSLQRLALIVGEDDDLKSAHLDVCLLTGEAAKFVSDTLYCTPEIGWTQLGPMQYEDNTHMAVSLKKFKRDRQERHETVSTFAKRLEAEARAGFGEHAYKDAFVQSQVVEQFVDGIRSVEIKRELISGRFPTLEKAAELAIREASIDQEVRMRRARLDELKAMEVDNVETVPITHKEIQEIRGIVAELMAIVSKPQPSYNKGNTPRTAQQARCTTGDQPYMQRQPATWRQSTCPNSQSSAAWQRTVMREPFERPQYAPPPGVCYQWTSNNQPICLACGKVGHRWRQCRS
ncbi:PREDICTED: uncharacterized protein LOC106804888 isoform X2 [Priapulus caudatus]|uniref:Uncharacterized protein LOC106804888 isoform X2 n=1 Tax=Priapulus caudatus TaxID=37621 RepID=A0ABM1DPA3_PRICU|nr:PREDICTED: uncharacterized protein LOC106804888 isoform X2 [Priapulus caudatus]